MQSVIQVTLPSTALPEEAQAYFATHYETPFVITVKMLPNGTARYALAPFGDENIRSQTPRVAYNEGSFGGLVTGTLPTPLAEKIVEYAQQEVREYSVFLQHAREALRLVGSLPGILQRLEGTEEGLSTLEEEFQRLSTTYAKHLAAMEDAYKTLNDRLLLQDAQITKIMRDVQDLSRFLSDSSQRSSAHLTERVTTLEGMLTAQTVRAETAMSRAAHAETVAAEAGGRSMTALATALDAQTTAKKAYSLVERLAQDLSAYQQTMEGETASLRDALRVMKAHVYPQVASLEGRVQQNTRVLTDMQNTLTTVTQRVSRLEEFEQAVRLYPVVDEVHTVYLEERVARVEEQAARQDRALSRMAWALSIETLILAGAIIAYGIRFLGKKQS